MYSICKAHDEKCSLAKNQHLIVVWRWNTAVLRCDDYKYMYFQFCLGSWWLELRQNVFKFEDCVHICTLYCNFPALGLFQVTSKAIFAL